MTSCRYQGSKHSILTDPFASNQINQMYSTDPMRSSTDYAPLSRLLSLIGYNGREGGENLDEDPEMADFSAGTKGNRPLSQSYNSTYWNPRVSSLIVSQRGFIYLFSFSY